MKILILLSFLIAIIVTPSFAEITVNTNQETFSGGDTVILTGNVDGASSGDFVAIEVKDPSGDTILIRTISVDSDGNYNLEFKTPKSSEIGNYEIIANANVNGNTVTNTKTISQETTSPNETEQTSTTSNEGGGCLIATATYGSELSPEVQKLREFRDNKLLHTESGTSFMESFNSFYYSFSPQIADYERENPAFKEAVKLFITPMIASLSILNHVDMDSEVGVLGYGISLIVLNLGMYVGMPVAVVIGTKKRF